MDWKRLYRMQAELDQHIMNAIPQTKDEIYDDKVLALYVEIGELANETRCFKYWSQKGPSDRETILEEYVDGIHFILSIGLDLGFHFDDEVLDIPNVDRLTTGFQSVYSAIERLKQSKDRVDYDRLMNQYLALGHVLSFSTDDIVQAYIDKNEKNHERQEQGY
ncbi:dimeric dUTPase (all-alpha-NTP-PPase superfamily) [Alkalibacillus flavidus]|uniref:Dimeric dUTPase (All-alpha-NTP-PPase superfamily) n=1 Tax=Alkalibacillus flavidus TaxID=546021 RepID=A0ABV2KSP9_9BACI